MRTCVVGNGPSARDSAALVDTCDFVVRLNNYLRAGQPSSGVRVDAVALFGDPCHNDGLPVTGRFEWWLTLPATRCRPMHAEHCGDVENVYRLADMRPIRWVSEGAWHNELRWLMENNGGRWAAPSTGFTAVDMAIRCLPTDTLVLVGFDATTPDKDGWGDHTGNWPANLVAGHNFALEKQAIAQLRDDGRWLFESMPVAVEWPGAPC